MCQKRIRNQEDNEFNLNKCQKVPLMREELLFFGYKVPEEVRDQRKSHVHIEKPVKK